MHPIPINTYKRMKRKGTYGLLVLAVLLFASCMVGKKYEKPATPSGITYPNATKTDTSALATWFSIYHDTALQTLIKMAIDSNRDLLAAASRMQEALALSGAVKANLYPKLSYQAAAGGGKAGAASLASRTPGTASERIACPIVAPSAMRIPMSRVRRATL